MLARALGFAKAAEESLIPTSTDEVVERIVKNEHPHGRWSRLRAFWSKIMGKDPIALAPEKTAFSRLDGGRKLLSRGLLPKFHVNELAELNEKAVSIPKAMQIQSGKGPIVRRETQWKKMTDRGGRFADAEANLQDQVVAHVPMPKPDGYKYVRFKDKG